ESGHFEFAHVAPGQYFVVADTDVPPGPADPQDRGLSARRPLTVGTRDVSGLQLDGRPGAFVQGRIVFNGTAPRPQPAQLTQLDLRLEPVDPIGPVPFWRARVTADGFRFGGLPRGRYILRIGAVPRWIPQSATIDGVSVLDSPIEISGQDLNDLVITFGD